MDSWAVDSYVLDHTLIRWLPIDEKIPVFIDSDLPAWLNFTVRSRLRMESEGHISFLDSSREYPWIVESHKRSYWTAIQVYQAWFYLKNLVSYRLRVQIWIFHVFDGTCSKPTLWFSMVAAESCCYVFGEFADLSLSRNRRLRRNCAASNGVSVPTMGGHRISWWTCNFTASMPIPGWVWCSLNFSDFVSCWFFLQILNLCMDVRHCSGAGRRIGFLLCQVHRLHSRCFECCFVIMMAWDCWASQRID